ncbi:MAG: diacylglycerol kinase family protein [Clostridia bacterium]|nr:diacylglycerol kinase family protein [Clostridia bacterium]
MKLENEKCSNAFVCAARGIKEAIKTEANLKFDILVAIIIIACGFFFRINMVEWIVCILAIGVMLFAELMNTAVEAVVDLYTREKNKQAERAKDISAGAVFILSINVAIIGLIIFIPKVVDIINK